MPLLLFTIQNIPNNSALILLLFPALPSLQTLLPAVGYPGPGGSSGIFYKGDGKQLGIQLLGALVVFLWSLGLSLGLFLLLKALKVLRVPAASEGIGEQNTPYRQACLHSCHMYKASESQQLCCCCFTAPDCQDCYPTLAVLAWPVICCHLASHHSQMTARACNKTATAHHCNTTTSCRAGGRHPRHWNDSAVAVVLRCCRLAFTL
jgi:hypothetical protein